MRAGVHHRIGRGIAPARERADRRHEHVALLHERPHGLRLRHVGDLHLQNKQPAEALSAYGEVIERNTAIGPVVMEAMQRVDKMLRDANHLPELANAYGIVWQRMPQPEASVIVRATPFYWRVHAFGSRVGRLGLPGARDHVRLARYGRTGNARMHGQ